MRAGPDREGDGELRKRSKRARPGPSCVQAQQGDRAVWAGSADSDVGGRPYPKRNHEEGERTMGDKDTGSGVYDIVAFCLGGLAADSSGSYGGYLQ